MVTEKYGWMLNIVDICCLMIIVILKKYNTGYFVF